MEDEDEVTKAVDNPPPSEQPLATTEPSKTEHHEIPDQCGTSSTAIDSSEYSPLTATEDEAPPSPVAEERCELTGGGEEVEVEERDEKENGGEYPPLVAIEDEAHPSPVAEGGSGLAGGGEEVEDVKELKSEGDKQLPTVEDVKMEAFPPVTEISEVKDEELVGLGDEMAGEEREVPVSSEEVVDDELVKIEELPPVVENVKVVITEELIGEKAVNQESGGDAQAELVIPEEIENVKVTTSEESIFEKEENKEELGGGVGDGQAQLSQVIENVKVETSEELTLEKAEYTEELGGSEKQEEEDSQGDEEVGGEEEEAEEMDNSQENGNDSSEIVTKNEELMEGDEEEEEEEEMPIADTEMETELETEKSSSGGKRRRGQKSKPVKIPAKKIVGEDVCFICLDGGDLVLCDRRGCPKAYHPSCVDHDEEFFKSKGRWNCGWHLCNKCGKNAYFMCYTCTFSLCKGCSKDSVVFCIRGKKGFCESCMKTVMMIENSEQNDMVAFDDKSSWEYLFKDYWIEQKEKLCITSDELAQAKNPWKGSDATDKQSSLVSLHESDYDVGSNSDSSQGDLEITDSKRKKGKRKSKSEDINSDSSLEKDASTPKRKSKRRLKSKSKEGYSDSERSSGNLDKVNKRGKKAIKLLKSRSKDGNSASDAANKGTSPEGSTEWASKELLEFVMHMRNGDKSVVSQFDVQGLLLEYIKRNKLRDPRRQSQIICDTMLQNLFRKPRVGHFEMLKLLESHFLLKEDSQADENQGSVVDTEISQLDADDNTDSLLDGGRSKGRKSRRRGEERLQSNLDDYAAIDMHNINLIYLRRNLMEALLEDSETFHDKVVGSFVRIRISGSSQKQDIYRLVQIIGTSKAAEPYKVCKRTADVMLEILNLDKTEIIQIDTISNQEFTEDECKRLRQSIKCGLLSRMTVGDVLEKARELHEVRVIDWLEAETLRLSHLRDRASDLGRKKELRECVEKLQLLKTPEERQRRLKEIPEVHADPKMDPSYISEDESEMHKGRQSSDTRRRESGFFRRENRESFSSRQGSSISSDPWSGNPRSPIKKWEQNSSLSIKGSSSRRDDSSIASQQTSEHVWNPHGADRGTPRSNTRDKPRISDPLTSITPESKSSQSQSTVAAQREGQVNETEKMWHYRDPTDKVQGPFSIVQLRKWSNTGYFPADLRIWKTSQTESDSILLTEALAGRFQKESPSVGNNAPPSMDTSKLSGDRYGSSNLPSPTPARSPGSQNGKKPFKSRWSSPSSPFRTTNQFQGANERLPSPTPTSPLSNPRGLDGSNFSQKSKDGGVFTQRPRSDSLNPTINSQQTSSQTNVYGRNQALNQPNSQPDGKTAGQGFSNVVQPNTGQNPSVYNHGWAASGYASTPNNPNAVPQQLAYGQWTGAPPANNQAQAPTYGAGYPPGQGNIPTNFPAMASHNASTPVMTNMPWGGQQPQPQQQPLNPNMGWAVPPAPAAFGPPGVAVAGPMGQLAGPTTPMMGWPGTGPNPSTGGANQGWVAPPQVNAGPWGGDQNHNVGLAPWTMQSSFGSGGAVPSGPGLSGHQAQSNWKR